MIATEPLPDDAVGRDRLARPRDPQRRPALPDLRPADRRRTHRARRSWGALPLGVAHRPVLRAPARCARRACIASLVELFPALHDVAITHRWGGVLGVPRDWFASVQLDRATGLATAGGYAGDGVTLTNLAGRTLADLITERESDLTALPWVGHRSRDFEPEPLRFVGINAGLRLADWVDRREERTGRPRRRPRQGPVPAHRPLSPPSAQLVDAEACSGVRCGRRASAPWWRSRTAGPSTMVWAR